MLYQPPKDDFSNQLSKLLKKYPSLKEVAAALDATEYLSDYKGGTKFDVKSWLEGRLGNRSLQLAENIEILDFEISPPLQTKSFFISGSKNFLPKKTIPRLEFLQQKFKEENIAYTLFIGVENGNSFRKLPYYFFHLTNQNKGVFVCNAEGNSSFTLNKVPHSREDLDKLLKTPVSILATQNPSLGVKIKGRSNLELWYKKLRTNLTLETGTLDLDSFSLENTMSAPPLNWMNLNQIRSAATHKTNYEITQRKIDEQKRFNLEEHSGFYRAANNQIAKFYSPELSAFIIQQLDEMAIPENYVAFSVVQRQLRERKIYLSSKSLRKIIEEDSDHETKTKEVKLNSNQNNLVCDKEFLEKIVNKIILAHSKTPPEGWLNKSEMKALGFSMQKPELREFKEKFPDSFGYYVHNKIKKIYMNEADVRKFKSKSENT